MKSEDQADELPGLVLGLGFSGSGFEMRPVVGEKLADMATGNSQCPISLKIGNTRIT